MSAGASWSGGVAPVNGDLVIVPAGCTITQDADITLGSKASGVGNALTINGAVGNHGVFKTMAGFTLTLAGFNSSNRPIATTAYGEFDRSSGGTVLYDLATNIQSTCSGIWTQNPGSGAIDTIPGGLTGTGGNLNWNNTGGAAYTTSGSTGWYDVLQHQMCAYLGNVGISNAAGTAIGTFGDTSLSFSAITPAGALAAEVSTLAQVTSVGKYWVDYENGYVFFYQTNLGTSAFTPAYKYLTFPGPTFLMAANANGNQTMIDGGDFRYLGNVNSGGDDFIFYLKDKTFSGTERKAQVRNSRFKLCRRILGCQRVNGTDANTMFDFTGNIVTGCDGDAYGAYLGIFRANNSYCRFGNLSYKGARNASDGVTILPVVNVNVSTTITQTGLDFTDVVAQSAQFLYGGAPGGCLWPDCNGFGGFLAGTGSAQDTRQCENFSGTPGHPAVLDKIIFWHGMRCVNVGQYSTIQNSIFGRNYHHTINGPTLTNDILCPGVVIQNNLRLDATIGGAMVELGYNRRQCFDGAVVKNNTDVRSSTGFSFGDVFDTSGGTNVSHRLTWVNNLAYSDVVGFQRGAANAARNYYTHFTAGDFNATFGNGTAYSGWNRFATFTGLTNVTGVSLNNPSLATTQSGKALVWTHTSTTDRTLSWDGGTAVQLAQFNGVLTTAGANGSFSGTVSDAVGGYNTSLNNASCPIGHWLVMLTGAAAGTALRITNCTATQLTTVDVWPVLPAIGDAYVIIKSEVTLTASNAVDTVLAGIYAPSMPSSTQTDAAVGCTLNSITANPNFVDETRTVATWDAFLGGVGTEEAAYMRLFAAPTLARTSLYPYLKYGYTPRNLAYYKTGFGGADIGAFLVTGTKPAILQVNTAIRRAVRMHRARSGSDVTPVSHAPLGPAPTTGRYRRIAGVRRWRAG